MRGWFLQTEAKGKTVEMSTRTKFIISIEYARSISEYILPVVASGRKSSEGVCVELNEDEKEETRGMKRNTFTAGR